MAKLIKKVTQRGQFELYSERGILSYFLFNYLPDGENLIKFVNSLSFPLNCINPFANQKIHNPVFFGELVLGPQGFGSPDGSIFFKCNNQNIMIFIEAKFNETYLESCKKKKYNSTIKGQLELRWRAVSLYKNKSIKKDKKGTYLIETDAYRTTYAAKDTFYKNRLRISGSNLGSYRRLILDEGVKRLFEDYIEKCNLDDIYFLCITSDKENPFNNNYVDYPKLHNLTWDQSAKQFCWKSASEIEECNCL